jgi:hypothetical protein
MIDRYYQQVVVHFGRISARYIKGEKVEIKTKASHMSDATVAIMQQW